MPEDDTISFRVEGHAAPAGSKTAYPLATGGAVVTDKAKGGAEWTAQVALAGTQAMRGREPMDGPLRLLLTFYRVRPRSHYRTGRNAHLIRDAAPAYPDTKPDLLKLARRVEDALSGICYVDDNRIVQEVLVKLWGATPAVEVTLHRVQPGIHVYDLPNTAHDFEAHDASSVVPPINPTEPPSPEVAQFIDEAVQDGLLQVVDTSPAF